MSSSGPIVGCIDRWMEHLRGELEGGLDAILHEDVVFLSPIVFSPQRGREITKMYLNAAGNTLGGGERHEGGLDAMISDGDSADGEKKEGFRYEKLIREGHHAMLEFATTMRDENGRSIAVNGVDIITCDDDGQITEIKVMVRPLQAINLVHAQMKAMLEKLAG